MNTELWGTISDWAQAVSSTVVLFLILLQMKQVNQQILQNEDHTRFDRSWEFVKLYREELRDSDRQLLKWIDTFSALESDPDSELFQLFVCRYFKPRVPLFALLNQLIQHQEVDERVLFGYLEEEFNRFVEIGIKRSSAQEFKTSMAAKINLLLTLWGSQIKSSKMLYETAARADDSASAARSRVDTAARSTDSGAAVARNTENNAAAAERSTDSGAAGTQNTENNEAAQCADTSATLARNTQDSTATQGA